MHFLLFRRALLPVLGDSTSRGHATHSLHTLYGARTASSLVEESIL